MRSLTRTLVRRAGSLRPARAEKLHRQQPAVGRRQLERCAVEAGLGQQILNAERRATLSSGFRRHFAMAGAAQQRRSRRASRR